MQFDLPERCRAARETIQVPPFPLTQIRLAADRPLPIFRRRSFGAACLAGLSAFAIAAAAVWQQTHITFTHSGGMVIRSDAHSGSRPIHSDAEIREAAAHLDFRAILPQGLPAGTRPIRLFTSGSDVLAITYNLPGEYRRSHHMLWIFLANPSTLSGKMPQSKPYRLRTFGRSMSAAHWRVGPEEVIVVSNGLTPAELARLQRAMSPSALPHKR
jgi:hypothetical protein